MSKNYFDFRDTVTKYIQENDLTGEETALFLRDFLQEFLENNPSPRFIEIFRKLFFKIS